MAVKRIVFLVVVIVTMALLLCAFAEEESTELNLLCVPQEEWCLGMKEEFEKEFGITVNYVRMSTGEGDVGVVFSHDIMKQIEAGLPLVLSFPEDGTGYEIGDMSLVKGAKHMDAAQKWFDWALTAEAQALGQQYKAYQAPTVGGVELSYPELLEVNLIDYDFQWAGDNKKANVDKFINEIAGADDLKEYPPSNILGGKVLEFKLKLSGPIDFPFRLRKSAGRPA